MLSKIKSRLSHNLVNIPGWRTDRKIVVIESDDWGAVRMPSREVYDCMLAEGIRVDRDAYCRYDGLETADDLEALYDVLLSVKDKNGRHPIITANAVVANPDFERIKESGFSQYYYEPITESFAKSSRHVGAWDVWRQGMAEGLLHPQFHGREHLNVKKWLRTLRVGDEITRKAFDYGTFGLTSDVDSRIKNNYMGAFNSGLDEDIADYKVLLTEGLGLFERIFGYKSESFIATTYVWNPKIETTLCECGVKYLEGLVHQRIPLDDDTTFRYKKNNFTGRRSDAGLTYITRNCFYEPSSNLEFDWVSDCLSRIKVAFRWHKPAVIGMHRLNVIGSIDEQNRKRNLAGLKVLLDAIVSRWPQVEFMTTDQLGSIICDG